ncbi:putative BolA IbaG family protein [Lyophyllum shimeji]|uniref:BolA IbaG family protein n=1 Tax=Lyophyllum shimeji TaxID=47721 RepID=A0A9P3PDI8_LYOSH|nr:putative BolA IbaG family protein [Lyophyllum shimeji]
MLSLTRPLLPLVRVPLARTFTTTVARRTAADDGANEPILEGEQLIAAKLQDKFSPSVLKVQDISGGCGSFYAITIASEAFKGLPTVKQHKLVNETLKDEIAGIHGLQIKTIAQ